MSKPNVHREMKIELWIQLSHGHWQKGADIAAALQWPTRNVRAVCEAEPDRFISSQDGYKRADLATLDELETSYADLTSRGTKILDRAAGVYRAIVQRRNGALDLGDVECESALRPDTPVSPRPDADVDGRGAYD